MPVSMPDDLAEQLLGYFRDLMAVTVGCDPSLQRHTSASLHDELKELGERWGLQTVLAVVGLIDQTLVRIRHSVYSRVLLEATLIQICSLPDLQSIADLAAAADGDGSTARTSSTKPGEKKKLPINPPPAEPSADLEERPVAAVPAAPVAAAALVTAAAAAAPAAASASSSRASVDATADANSSAPSSVAVMEPATAIETDVQTMPSTSPAPAAWDQPTAERVWRDRAGRLRIDDRNVRAGGRKSSSQRRAKLAVGISGRRGAGDETV